MAKVLEPIGELLADVGQIITLPAGTVTYRAQGRACREDSHAWGAARLGTNVPNNATSSTRISPAGIPLFYGADDIETALAEVSHSDPPRRLLHRRQVRHHPARDDHRLDPRRRTEHLRSETGRYQGDVRFLNALIEELRQPIDAKRIHLDYVPTQVFCEFFLRVFEEHDIRGLRWTSDTAAGGGGAWRSTSRRRIASASPTAPSTASSCTSSQAASPYISAAPTSSASCSAPSAGAQPELMPAAACEAAQMIPGAACTAHAAPTVATRPRLRLGHGIAAGRPHALAGTPARSQATLPPGTCDGCSVALGALRAGADPRRPGCDLTPPTIWPSNQPTGLSAAQTRRSRRYRPHHDPAWQ